MHVAEKCLDKGHHNIFTDRYYTSIPLANELYTREQQHLLGLVCAIELAYHRLSAESLLKLSDNKVKAFRDSRMMTLEWRAPKSKSSVIMLSTESSAAIYDWSSAQSESR